MLHFPPEMDGILQFLIDAEYNEEKTKMKKTGKKVIIAAGLLIIAAAVMITLILTVGKDEKTVSAAEPTVMIETPAKIPSDSREPFFLDVSITSMGEALYPAASMSISFDSEHLEFLGIAQGNVHVLSDEAGGKLPEWGINAERCNEIGQINTMYLDITNGKNAFSGNLLGEDKNVLLRLEFRLRDGASAGDIYELAADDICLAASDSSQSLSTVQGTLSVVNGRIVVG